MSIGVLLIVIGLVVALLVNVSVGIVIMVIGGVLILVGRG